MGWVEERGLGPWEHCWGGVGGGETPGGGGEEEGKSPCWVRNVAAGAPLTLPATPGQVCPLEQNKEAARSASVHASGVRTSPELRFQEPTPRSETLQPTSPGVSARRREQKGKRGQPHPGTRDAGFLVLSGTMSAPPSAAGPGPRAGRPMVQGAGTTRFPRSPRRTKQVSLV